MTFNVGHVDGGSNAGWRIVKPKPPKLWVCDCTDVDGFSPTFRPGYLARCPDCKMERRDRPFQLPYPEH